MVNLFKQEVNMNNSKEEEFKQALVDAYIGSDGIATNLTPADWLKNTKGSLIFLLGVLYGRSFEVKVGQITEWVVKFFTENSNSAFWDEIDFRVHKKLGGSIN
jgi:hypothetical protein